MSHDISPFDDAHLTQLSEAQRAILAERGCVAARWDDIRVDSDFNPTLLARVRFDGPVVLISGSGEPGRIEDCTIADCRIVLSSTILRVHSLISTDVYGDVELVDCGEIGLAEKSTFGVYSSDDGGPVVEAGNENGRRRVLPLPGLDDRDAAFMAEFGVDPAVAESLGHLKGGGPRPERTTIREHARVTRVGVLRSAFVGPASLVRDCFELTNVYLGSTSDEPVSVTNGCVLRDCLVNRGVLIDSQVSASNTILMPSSRLENGARLQHVVLGANSTIAGAEVQHALLSPFHEQHHSSSFLIAVRIHGQSNIAAGAVIGSNHNSRGPDGEIRAGRGFWPGLVSSLKHNSSFASYTLLSKGAYPSEINNPLPFSLLSTASTGLVIYPAFWFEHNMYALARNAWKYPARDRRTEPKVPVEFDYLAPDVMTEIARALDFLEGHDLISGNDESTQVTGIEKGHKPSLILHPRKAAQWYKDLVHLNLARCLHRAGVSERPEGRARQNDPLSLQWRNLGGMVVELADITRLQNYLSKDNIVSLASLHERYSEWLDRYEEERCSQAFALYERYCGNEGVVESKEFWSKAMKLEEELVHRIRTSRQKDFSDPTRSFTFETSQERDVILGSFDGDPLVEDAESSAKARIAFYESQKG